MLVSFRSLRASMVRQGLFLSSKSFYAWKTLSLLGMYFTVATILAHARDTWAGCLAAAFTLALCWQQTGWLSHDFLHHQVFKNRVANTVCGYVAGNVLQGFSVDWWKNKHNKHHAVPNECSEHAEAVDPGALVPCSYFAPDMVSCASLTRPTWSSCGSCNRPKLHRMQHATAVLLTQKHTGLRNNLHASPPTCVQTSTRCRCSRGTRTC